VAIKMNIKRAYCPDCGVLVDLHEKKAGETLRMTCCRCDRPIWVRDGINWRFVKKVSALAAQPEIKETRPIIKAETRRQAKPEAKEARPAGRRPREARNESRPPRQSRPPREARPSPKPEIKAAPKTEVKAVAKAEPKAEAKK